VRDINVFGPGEFRLVRCDGCGLAYLDPRPGPADIGAYYPTRYWAPPTAEGTAHYVDAGMRRALTLLAREYPGGRVLDVGCGVGNMPALMRERGLDAVGLEPYEHAAQIARERYGLEVVCSFLQDAELPEGSFDAITMFDVLEHVHDPVGDLRTAYSLLKPGGAVVIKVPNFAALQAGLFGPWWYWLDPPRHLFNFTPRSLARALEAAGFPQVRSRAVPDLVGALVFETSVIYWLRGRHLARRGVQIEPGENETVGQALDGQVYASVPSAGKWAFRWFVRNVLYAPLAAENLVGRSVELLAVGRKPE
jgi:SAM-dependent methyltransferase